MTGDSRPRKIRAAPQAGTGKRDLEQVRVGLTLSTAHSFTASELNGAPASLVSASLLSKVSGKSSRSLDCSSVSLKSLQPALPGEVISIAAEVTEVRPAHRCAGM